MTNKATSIKIYPLQKGLFLFCCIFLLLANLDGYGQRSEQNEKKASVSGDIQNEKGRNLILSGNINAAIASYAPLAQTSPNNTLIAEYAYALALGGIYDAALITLDRIESQFNESDVNYFTSQVFILMGYDDIATEFWKLSDNNKIPSWIALNATILSEKHKSNLKGLKKLSRDELIAKFKSANELTGEHLYLESIAQFHELIDFLPNEYLPYAGYSIPLEKIGAFEKSEQVVEKALSLIGKKPEHTDKSSSWKPAWLPLNQKRHPLRK